MDESGTSTNPVIVQYKKLVVTYQELVNKVVPLTMPRWLGFLGLLAVFILRIVLSHGWYIICYTLGIYLLNLLLAFLSPKFDPLLELELRDEGIEEGVPDVEPAEAGDDEFRPFIRRLPEFKFWYNGTRATLLSLVMSFFPIFDIPVFWPILLVYFVVLFSLTMRRQIQHMIKYKYLPFDFGKTKYRT